jgi:N utilization substance protein A
MNKIIEIIDSIAYEKGLQYEEVEEVLKEALIITAQKTLNANLQCEVIIDRETKELTLYHIVEVVYDDDELLLEQNEAIKNGDAKSENNNFICLEDALKIDDSLNVGEFLKYNLDFENMNRSASSILFQTLEYKLQHKIEQDLYFKYKEKVGKLISCKVVMVDKDENTYVEIDDIRGMLTRKHRIKGESFKVGDVFRSIIRNVKVDKTQGLIVEVSRTSPKFLQELLALEVPEIGEGKVSIKSCARIPGVRAKISISANAGIDPIGSIVGVKGVRILAVSNELNGENIDCVEHSDIGEELIKKALSPASVVSVEIIKEPMSELDIETSEVRLNYEDMRGKAIVGLYEDQKGKAIGKIGLNIRLASMLSKYEIELVIKEGVSPNSEFDNNYGGNNNRSNNGDTTNLEALFS